ncbi:MAG TPA: ATP-dependent DNA helicase, partial [Clostridia bacterium]|nr:ATP-dependent DNA helicase [Clostridia bacterium]
MEHIVLPVRQLVEFVIRGGDINNTFVGRDSLTEGAKAHRKYQSKQGDGYSPEVTLSVDIEKEGILFTLQGRADGIYSENQSI